VTQFDDDDDAGMPPPFSTPLVDTKATEAVVEAMSVGKDDLAPDTLECPECVMPYVDTETVALTFPMRYEHTCRVCKHTWETED